MTENCIFTFLVGEFLKSLSSSSALSTSSSSYSSPPSLSSTSSSSHRLQKTVSWHSWWVNSYNPRDSGTSPHPIAYALTLTSITLCSMYVYQTIRIDQRSKPKFWANIDLHGENMRSRAIRKYMYLSGHLIDLRCWWLSDWCKGILDQGVNFDRSLQIESYEWNPLRWKLIQRKASRKCQVVKKRILMKSNLIFYKSHLRSDCIDEKGSGDGGSEGGSST